MSAAATSTVNLAEVHGKLVGRGLNADEAWEATLSPIREAVAFTSEHARRTGDLARTNPCTRLVIGGPGVFGTRTGFEGAGIHGRQVLEEAQSQRSHPRHPLRVIVSAGRDGIRAERRRLLYTSHFLGGKRFRSTEAIFSARRPVLATDSSCL